MHHRRGSVFLFVLGVVGVLFALAMSLLASTRQAKAGAFEVEPDVLADQAAREGLAHAIGAIRTEFATGAGIPTTLHDRWRSHFWAIDTHHHGRDTSSWNDDEPTGNQFTAEDFYENDVHVENLLIEPYLEYENGNIQKASSGVYLGRNQIYRAGFYAHPGTARWYEPGLRSADPVAEPLSFHLDHPVAADSGSPDPAIRAGENHPPAVDVTLRYDEDLRPTDDPLEVRYRLRYAVAVEDLGGHLLVSLPGAYDPAATAAPAGVPARADLLANAEIDGARAARYAPAFAEMTRHLGQHNEWFEAMFRGYGWQVGTGPWGGLSVVQKLWSAPSLAGVTSSGTLLMHVDHSKEDPEADEPDLVLDRVHPPVGGWAGWNREVAHQLVGPTPTFQTLAFGRSSDHAERPYLLTPFGKAPRPVATPDAWDEARQDVDTPWRVNLPTAPQKSLAIMLYGYLPAEFKTMVYERERIEDWNDAKGRFENGVWYDLTPPKPYTLPTIDIFDQLATAGHFDQRGGIGVGEPYPGTDPDAPGTAWRSDLGATCSVNEQMPMSKAHALGSNEPWGLPIFFPVVKLEERFVGGNKITVYPDHRGDVAFTSADGYWFHDSYWLDIAAAATQTLSLANWAWADRINGAHDGDPLSGIPVWPATMDPTYFAAADAPAFAPGTPTLDLDVDGDGTPDVVSALDTVEELDRQFLRNLGEDPTPYPLGTRPTDPVDPIYVEGPGTHDGNNLHPNVARNAPAWVEQISLTGKTIKGMLVAGDVTADEAGLMELVVNDLRMSFFGASPQYGDFRPLDLDDDGTVRCSAYTTGTATAEADGRGPAVDTFFSLTGYFVFEKSRYYRIFVRGELFDELRQLPVARSDREAVYVCDPDGDVWNLSITAPASTTTGMADSHLLFQRRLTNHYRGFQSHGDR